MRAPKDPQDLHNMLEAGADPEKMLALLRQRPSDDDLDDAYCGSTCEDCGANLKYDRTVPRGPDRPLYCPECTA